MRKPNLFIAGAQKCGTTTLANILGKYDDIYMHPNEVHYFNKDELSKEEYYSLFAAHKEKYLAEKTPAYLEKPQEGYSKYNSLSRFINYCQKNDPIVIFCMRNPVERALSAINHHIVKGRINPLKKIKPKDFFSNKFAYYNVLGKGEYDYVISRMAEASIKYKLFVLEEDLNLDWFIKLNKDIGLHQTLDSEFIKVHSNKRGLSTLNAVGRYIFPEHRFTRSIFREVPIRDSKCLKINIDSDVVDFLYEYYTPSIKNVERFTGRKVSELWIKQK